MTCYQLDYKNNKNQLSYKILITIKLIVQWYGRCKINIKPK